MGDGMEGCVNNMVHGEMITPRFFQINPNKQIPSGGSLVGVILGNGISSDPNIWNVQWWFETASHEKSPRPIDPEERRGTNLLPVENLDNCVV
jgi:hypothetical protein